jgi:CBS domain containing-hemolysin-like protein
MDSIVWLAWALLLVSAGTSFLCSASEAALFSLSRWQLQHLREGFPRRGGILAALLGSPEDLLATLALCNTGAFATMLGTAGGMALAGRWSPTLALIGVLLLTVFGCELLPKALAVRRPENWALRVAVSLRALHLVVMPLRLVARKLIAWLAPTAYRRGSEPQVALSDAEYEELLELAQQQGALQQSEKEIILQLISLDRRTVGEVMRPRSQMACIPDDLSAAEMVEAARRFRHRRLPMYDQTPDTIVGVLNTRVFLLNPEADLADAIEFPSFVPESMNLLQLLRSLQRQQRGMAMVLDEFGGTAGLVTPEDILEEVFGRAGAAPEVEGLQLKRLGEGRWQVSGAMRIDDFRRECPQVGEVDEVETMGGLLVQLTEVVPAQGESTTFRGLRLTAQVVEPRRVRDLLVERMP